MSQCKNQELKAWKDVLAKLRRIETTWRGFVLSTVDHETYTSCILYNAMILNDLSNQYDGLGNMRTHVSWAHNCARVDVSDLASFLSDAIVLFRSLSDEKSDITSYSSFKRKLLRNYPFCGDLLGTIGGAIDLHIKYKTAATFYPVYQVLSFMTHLSLQDIDMSEQLEREYCEQEEFLSQLHLPDRFISQMNSVMKEWLRDFRIESDDFVPGHGPGSVAEFTGRCLYDKYQALSPDRLIEYVFSKYAGLDVWTCVPFGRGTNRYRSDPTSRQATVVFVPKSMKTFRVISKEPATLMYFQQGVARAIDNYISQHRYLKYRIDLHDQTKQRDKALEASRTRQYATVDLSAASDSVSYELVERVFRGTPLYPYLVALRSKTALLPSGKVIPVTKFAPMGSALCFPIETLIFACIAECTARYVKYDTGLNSTQYRVYGDDIIVPDRCLTDLVIFLGWCGFRINSTKTYGGTVRFRESCGCDAYDGKEVTCLKIARNYSARRVNPRSPGSFEGLIAMANSAHDFKFQLLRRFLIDRLVNRTSYVPLFSKDRNVGVYSETASNFRLPHRQSPNEKNGNWYQRTEVKAAGVLTVESQLSSLTWDDRRKTFREGDPLPQAEYIRYFEWLRLTYNRDGDAFDPAFCPRVSVGNAGTYLSNHWTHTYDPLVDLVPSQSQVRLNGPISYEGSKV